MSARNTALRLFFAAGFALSLSSRLVAEEPLATVSDLAAVAKTLGRREVRPFALDGEIVASLVGGHAIFADATGRILVRACSNVVLRAGTKVRVSGQAFIDLSRQFQCAVFAAKEYGIFPLPPPKAVSVGRILDGQANHERVMVTGIITDVRRDDVDDDWSYCVVKSGGQSLLIAIPEGARGREAASSRLHALCRFTGVVLAGHANMRRYLGPHLELESADSIEVVTAAGLSPFDAPPLEDFRSERPEKILKTGLRTLTGRVAAVWGRGRRMIVIDVFGEPHNVELIDGEPPPPCDSQVTIAGYPTTDLYAVNFRRAQVRVLADRVSDDRRPDVINPSMLFRDTLNRSIAPMAFLGWPVKMTGVVSGKDERGRVLIGKCGYYVAYDIDQVPSLAPVLADGTRVEVTGVCVTETDSWRPGEEFTDIRGFFVAARRESDVKVLARASWWTEKRFFTVIGVLVMMLAALAILSLALNRIVRRRSQELYRKDIDRVSAELRTEDRMRLATELHDTISQSLTGVALQVDSALLAEGAPAANSRRHLDSARQLLENCREELRNCLWDLRSRTLDEKDPAVAIRRTVAPHLGAATLVVDFAISRAAFSDQTFHDLLCILRELVVNAVRHGKATRVSIAARRGLDSFEFVVADDGCGFDPARRPGVNEGHFGLVGIEERLKFRGGRLKVESALGQGTTVTFTIERAWGR